MNYEAKNSLPFSYQKFIEELEPIVEKYYIAGFEERDCQDAIAEAWFKVYLKNLINE